MALGLLFIVLAAIWVFLLFVTFRDPAPKLRQLFAFVGLLAVTGLLFYVFMIRIMHVNPNPTRVRIARLLVDDKTIYLGDFVPGLFDLGYIHRIDVDWEDEEIKEEWLAFYKYDVSTPPQAEQGVGPFGGAIYDYDRCRPPVIHSFELVPVNYDYLGADSVSAVVENIIPYDDPLSLDENAMEIDRPEVIIEGVSRGALTDLNIFRKIGWDWECVPRRTVQTGPRPEQVVVAPFVYENIGSFRGSYQVSRSGATVTVKDSAGFERSQIVAYRVYTPKNGSYFRPQTPDEIEQGVSKILWDPVEVGLAFGPSQPDETRQVYYPEKTVLAFYRQIGQNPDEALSYTCGAGGKSGSDYHPQDYGLTVPPDDLQKVIVCELAYNPDVVGEQNHAPQKVKAKVVEVVSGGSNSCAHAHQVECTVAAAPNPQALPYGCEWCILECRQVP